MAQPTISDDIPREKSSPGDYRDVAGICSWFLEIPEDLEKEEYGSMHWDFPSVAGKKNETKPAGIDLKAAKPGSTVKIFLWTREWNQHKGKKLEGMPFCIKYLRKDNKYHKETGTLQIPNRYSDIHGFPASDGKPYHDGGWFLMIRN